MFNDFKLKFGNYFIYFGLNRSGKNCLFIFLFYKNRDNIYMNYKIKSRIDYNMG